MNLLKFLFAIVGFSMISFTFGQVPTGFSRVDDIAFIKNEISKSSEQTQSISSGFIQEKHLTMMEEVLVSHGRFLFKKENKVRWEYTEPIVYAIIINQNRFIINNDGKISEFDTGSNKLFKEINNMIVMAIQGNFVDDPDFKATFYQNKESYLAVLSPQNDLLKDILTGIEIYFTKVDLAVSMVKFIEPGDDFTKIIFTNRQANMKLIMNNSARNNSFFRLLVFAAFLLGVSALSSCRTSEKVSGDAQIKVSQPWIFSADFQKALYKTNMMIFGNELSGLTLIKKTGKDFRVVFMSEIGLKYFDMEFFTKNDSIKIHHVISLLDRKPVLDLLENNLKLIFVVFPAKIKEHFYLDPTTKSMVKEIKHKGNKSLYSYDKNFGQVNTIRNKKRGTNQVISLRGFDNRSPQTININQRNLSLRLEKIEP
jgi:outer membrane lipoprotein-sorting protein